MNVLEEWIPRNYLYQLIVQLITCSRLILSGLIFFRPLQKKPKYAGRLIGALGICLALLAALVLLRTQYDLLVTRFVMRIFQFAMPLIIVLLCYRGSVHLRLKFLCAGIAAMESDLQFSKAKSPMVSTLAGSAIVASRVHSRKARSPMAVTPSGRATLVRLLHFSNARSPTAVMPVGAVYSLASIFGL